MQSFLRSLLLVIAAAGLALFAVLRSLPPPKPSPTLLIQQIRTLGHLVTLEVPVHTTQGASINGHLGGIRAVALVEGDVQLSVDLEQACVLGCDEDRRYARLRLPPPKASRPRLDHQRSRVVIVQRSGLWLAIPGPAGESKVVALAMRQAEERLAEAVDMATIMPLARRHAEEALTQFFRQLGWTIEVAWADATP